jgi:hypothetical protein
LAGPHNNETSIELVAKRQSNNQLGKRHPRSIDREGVRGYALNPQNAAALWKKSEEMIGEVFALAVKRIG